MFRLTFSKGLRLISDLAVKNRVLVRVMVGFMIRFCVRDKLRVSTEVRVWIYDRIRVRLC